MAPNLAQIKPGDLVLTRTASRLYNILRAFTSEPYDHIAVVLNDKLVLHIGPGRVRTLSLVRLLEPKRSPLVLRPVLTTEEKSEFLERCWSMIGEKYDLVRIFDFVLRLILLNWTQIKVPFSKIRVDVDDRMVHDEPFEHTQNRQWLCSDAIMHQLVSVHDKYRRFLAEDKDSELDRKEVMLNNLGSLTINDFITIAKGGNDLFEIIELPLSNKGGSGGGGSLSEMIKGIIQIVKELLSKVNELNMTQKLLLGLLMVCIFNILSQKRKEPSPIRSKL